mgnify:CR=1 FL=1
MNLQRDKVYNGFRLISDQQVKEVNSQVQLFEHEKSGARLLFLGNDDDNKVFSITFRTPPEDSTGVAHIVEHAVLCGSRKFPLKEPFVELIKGSLNTFLNAMTYPDKTMYPVASRNDKDFRNLMDVYLDAVFFPAMLNEREILMQEGWHYEIDKDSGELIYKGVVYNEMKGAFSSPDAILEHQVMAALFPDTTYGFESGGDPDVIPELTYKMFTDFHSKYYHPSNCYIFLYGNLEICDTLKFLDSEYLAHFDRQSVDSEISIQPAFTEIAVKNFSYPISTAETVEDKSLLAMAAVVGQATDTELCLSFRILSHLLLETPAAPLKKAIIEAGIGKEVSGYFIESLKQPVFSVMVAGSNEKDRDKLAPVIEATLRHLCDNGIDNKLLEASINSIEFKLREANYGGKPKGLAYNIKCMDSWLYDADPSIHLAYESTLQQIKSNAKQGFFENKIKEYLLDNKHQIIIALVPEPGLGEKRAEELHQELAAYKANLNESELVEIGAQTKKLKERQDTPDSEEALATIPLLDLKDIKRESEVLPFEERVIQDIPVLVHSSFTNKITYLGLYFETRHVPQNDIPWLYLLADVMGKINTANHDYSDLANEINLHTGGMLFDVWAYADKERDDLYYPKFRIRTKALLSHLQETLRLVGEVAGRTVFRDHKRLKEIIRQSKANWDTALFRRGQQVVASRVLSYFSHVAKYNETGVLTYYQFLIDLEKKLSHSLEDVAAKLEETVRLVFTRDNLLISLTCEEDGYNDFQKHITLLTEGLGTANSPIVEYDFQSEQRNEGIMTSGKVQYVAKGANFRDLGYHYHGSMKVLETILRYEYLWNRVRVQGGAYGGFAQFERTGNMVFGSYRDPNLAETVKVYDETATFLSEFDVSQREMTKYIIGTMSQLDTPLTPQMKGERLAMMYIRGISQSDIQQERDEVLSTNQDSIKQLGELVDKAMQANYLCVLGSEQKIKANRQMFKQLISMSDQT